MKLLKIFSSLALIIFSISCVNKNDIPGVYVNQKEESLNIDTIKIYKNGFYERFIYDKKSKKLIYRDKRTWKLNDNSNLTLISFLENYGGYSLENVQDNYDEYLIHYSFPINKSPFWLSLQYGLKGDEYFLKQ